MLPFASKFGYLIDKSRIDGIERLNVAVAIVNSSRKILVAQRSADKKFLPNLWHLPGGKVEDNETIEAAIIREIREELSLDILDILADTGFVFDYIGHNNEKTRTCFLLVKAEGKVQVDFENQDYRFIDITDLPVFFLENVWEINRNVFQYVLSLPIGIESNVY